MIRWILPLLVVLPWLTPVNAQSDCPAVGEYRFTCGMENAEDLVAIPDTDWLIASSMVPGGGLYLVDAQAKSVTPFYPGAVATARHDLERFGQCPGSPDPGSWITHGLNVRGSAAGHATLYVVSHGDREAVEVFEVDVTGREPALAWVGCVLMPHGLEANSVAAFADGTLVATVLMHPGTSFEESLAGIATGAVYLWVPGDAGFTLVRGTELPTNNGIEVANDQQSFFVASSGLSAIVAFSRSNPARRLGTTERLPFTPDNVHMNAAGMLVSAGMVNDEPACGGDPTTAAFSLEQLASCPRGFHAALVDPETLQFETLATGSRIPAFSNATMAIEAAGEVWVGSFAGDRVARVKAGQ